MKVATPRQREWMTSLIGAVLVLNAIDAIATLIWIETGLAREANPLMAELLEAQPVLFVAAKLALVGLGSYLLWRYRDRALSVVAITLLFIVYYAVVIYHLSFSSYLVWDMFG